MARLVSEDSNCPSYLEIRLVADKKLPSYDTGTQSWQQLFIELVSGGRSVSTEPEEDTMVCRSPSDELGQLVAQLRELLDSDREQVLFEPSEPSFELTFSRTRGNGIKLEAWLDAGNGTTGIYTWDASGIRFLTTEQRLRSFVDSLASEFGLQKNE